MRCTIIVCALMFLAQSSAYRIRVKANPEEGKSVKVSLETHDEQTLITRDQLGTVTKSETRKMTGHEDWVGTTVEGGSGKVTLRRSWSRAEQIVDGRRAALPMEGQTATISVSSKDIGVTLASGRPWSKGARQSVVSMVRGQWRADAENHCVPAMPTAVGATWDVPSEWVGDCFAETAVLAGPAEAQGKLLSVDAGYAILEIKFAMKASAFGAIDLASPAAIDGTMRMRVSLTNPLDWTSTRDLHLVGTVRVPGMAGTTAADLKGTTITKVGG